MGVRDINSTGLKKPGAIPAFLFLDFVALEGFINLNRLARPRLRGNDGILGSGFAFDYSSFRVVIQTFERNESALNATIFKINCGKRFWVVMLEHNYLAIFI